MLRHIGVQFKHRMMRKLEKVMVTKKKHQRPARTARIYTRTTDEVKELAECLAFNAGISVSAWIEKLIKDAKK